jgi:hypothetical protein
MPGHASIAQFNSQVAGVQTFHDHAFIHDRTVAFDSTNRFSKSCRRACSVMEQPHLPEVASASQPESERRVLNSFRGKLKKPDLARNSDAHVFVIYLPHRKPARFRSGSSAMPASRTHSAASRVATPSASGGITFAPLGRPTKLRGRTADGLVCSFPLERSVRTTLKMSDRLSRESRQERCRTNLVKGLRWIFALIALHKLSERHPF